MKTNYENSLENLKVAYDVLESLDTWNHDEINNCLMDSIKRLGIKNGQMLWPVRTALSGKKFTPGGAIEIADILGKAESLRRIKVGIDKLENR
jgi:glutamyl-tRNA synthetase